MKQRMGRHCKKLLAALLLVGSSWVCAQASLQPLHLRLGKRGEILAWLVAGPYPDPGAFQLHGQGFEQRFPVESETDAAEGNSLSIPGGSRWKFAVGDSRRGLDLLEALGHRDEVFGYCYAGLNAYRATTARLLFGSDDGAKVFLNGKEIFSKAAPRGIKRDEDQVLLHLQKGSNSLLFKVEQLNQGWGLLARVMGTDGGSLAGVTEDVAVKSETPDAWSMLRKTAGTFGSIDIEQFQSLRQKQETVGRWLRSLRRYAEDPESLQNALTQTKSALGKPFANESALQGTVERNLLFLDRQFARSRSKLLKWAQNPGPLTSNGPELSTVKVMSGGRYFTQEGERSFVPIGYNHNPDWTELNYGNPLFEQYDPGRVDRWFRKLADHGVDIVRLMVETPPSGNLEEPVGIFRPEHVLWLDTIFTAAAKSGVRLWVTPYDTFWMNLRSDASPYWSFNGGPVSKPIDFLTSDKVRELQKRRMKFLIDRYGGSGLVFAWEIMNEIDLWWGASPVQIKAWTDDMAAYTHGYQIRRWGKDHLVTLSFGTPKTQGLNATTQYRRSDLDFATMHLYLGKSRAPGVGDEELAARDFAEGVSYARGQLKDARPVLDGESGPIDKWIADERFDDEVFHLMSWSHLVYGGAGSGTRWPYRNPHHITEGMLGTLHGMRIFCDGVDWHRLTGDSVTHEVTAGRWSGRSLGTKRGEIIWLRSPSPMGQVDIQLPSGSTCRVFDIAKMRWSREQISGGSSLPLDQPSDEIAIWLTKGA